MSPEELQARAARAYRAFHGDADVTAWALLGAGQQPWLAAAHAAVSYRPASERAKSQQAANIRARVVALAALAAEIAEEMGG